MITLNFNEEILVYNVLGFSVTANTLPVGIASWTYGSEGTSLNLFLDGYFTPSDVLQVSYTNNDGVIDKRWGASLTDFSFTTVTNSSTNITAIIERPFPLVPELSTGDYLERDTIRTITDWEGNVEEIPEYALAMNGAVRNVWNRVPAQAMNSGLWTKNDCTVVDTGETETIDGIDYPVYRLITTAVDAGFIWDAALLGANNDSVSSVYLKNNTIGGYFRIYNPDNTQTDITGEVTSEFKRFASDVGKAYTGDNHKIGFLFDSTEIGQSIDICCFQQEDVTGRTNQAPQEPTPVGIGTGPEEVEAGWTQVGGSGITQDGQTFTFVSAPISNYVEDVTAILTGRDYEYTYTISGQQGIERIRFMNGGTSIVIPGAGSSGDGEYKGAFNAVEDKLRIRVYNEEVDNATVTLSVKQCDPGQTGADGHQYKLTENPWTVVDNVATEGTATALSGDVRVSAEPQVTNKQQHPTDFTQWTNLNSTDELQSDGFTKVIDDATDGKHSVYRIGTGLSVGATHTGSALVKYGDIRYCAIACSNSAHAYAFLDFQTETISSSGGTYYVGSKVKKVADDTYIIEVQWTTQTTIDTLSIGLATTDGVFEYIGDGTGHLFVRYGNQTETASAVSGILTNGASTTKNADGIVLEPEGTFSSTAFTVVLNGWVPTIDQSSLTTTDNGMLAFTTSASAGVFCDSAGVRATDGTNTATVDPSFEANDELKVAWIGDTTSDKMQVGVKKEGTWSWSTEATYDGSILDTGNVHLAYNTTFSQEFGQVLVFDENNGTSWVEEKF